MKPILLKVFNSQESSIDIRHEKTPYFKNPWHFHPEIELNFIIEGSGTHFMGNNISPFSKNELTLTGPNLPHFWRCDPVYYQKNPDLLAEAIIIRFHEEFLGNNFLQLPEMQPIYNLLKISQRGLKIFGKSKQKAANLMREMVQMEGAERIISLLQILNTIAKSSDYKIMSSMGFAQNYGTLDKERMNEVYAYVIENFRNPIQLNIVASVAHMNPTAFCRYFKSKTGKTFTQFLHEIRIAHACKILIEGKWNVSQVCYECGFQNQSHFIKQFKIITNQTPLQYQKQHEKVYYLK